MSRLFRGAVLATMLAFTFSACQKASEPGAKAAASAAGKSTAAGTAACQPNAKSANYDFTLKDLHGKEMHLSQLKGKVILLDFWATWCGPCKLEIPWFVEFQKKYGPAGLQVVGISVDDTFERLGPYVTQLKMNYAVLQGLGHDDVQDAYGPLWGIPVTAVISRDGRICTKHIGFSAKESFEKEIKSL